MTKPDTHQTMNLTKAPITLAPGDPFTFIQAVEIMREDGTPIQAGDVIQRHGCTFRVVRIIGTTYETIIV